MASGDLSRINTNIAALNALNALNVVNSKLSVHTLRLATGKRINSAADDAAGFTIAAKLRVKSEGLGTALDNIASSKNLMTVAEGHLNNIQDILVEMKSKAQQAANGTIGTDERAAILEELQAFNSQIDAEVSQAKWAGIDILSTDKIFQIGIGTTSSDELSFNIAESVWTSGTSTTFNSAGLDVVAASSSTRTIATSAAVATTNVGLDATTPLATNSTLNNLATELSSGHYTLEVNTTGAGSGSATTIAFQLRDSQGELVIIDADDTAGGAVGTTLTATVAGDSGDPAEINLGVGFAVNLDNIVTSSGTNGSAILQLDYTNAGSSVSTMSDSQNFMDKVDSAINVVSEGLSYIGSMINRLEFQESSASVAKSNVEAARSRIVDADMAWEQLEATKLMILQQTATAMLAQANVSPQSVLALFG